MSTTDITTTFDVAALRRGFAEHDASAIVALYAHDATVEIADAQNPPSRPGRAQGADAIRAKLEDVLARDMTHELDIVAVGPEAIGYTLRCTYPDGTRVLCASTAQLRDGLIVREVGVQAWDAA